MLEATTEYERKNEDRQPRRKDLSHLDYFSLKAEIEANDVWGKELREWGKQATSEQLKLASNDLLSDPDERKLLTYLRIFKDLSYPHNAERLLDLANDNRRFVKRRAVSALANVNDSKVRQRALELLQSVDTSEAGAIMLSSNYKTGDFQIFENLLKQPMDEHLVHDIGWGIRSILDKNLVPEAESILLLLYELDPCSNCRFRFIRDLIKINKLPDWIRHECLYDANPDIVECTK